MGGPVVIGGDNLPSLVGIGLTDLPNIGEASGPPGPPGSGITARSCHLILMPGPCSGKNLISINRLYSKEKRPGSFEYNLLPNLISNFNHYMDRA